MLARGAQHVLPRHFRLAAADDLGLHLRHGLIFEAQYVGDVDGKEPARFDDGVVKRDDRFNQRAPSVEREVRLVLLADEVRGRPDAEGYAVRLDAREQEARVAFVDVVDSKVAPGRDGLVRRWKRLLEMFGEPLAVKAAALAERFDAPARSRPARVVVSCAHAR